MKKALRKAFLYSAANAVEVGSSLKPFKFCWPFYMYPYEELAEPQEGTCGETPSSICSLIDDKGRHC